VDMQMSQDKKRKPVLITLKQSSLIKKILKAISMVNCNRVRNHWALREMDHLLKSIGTMPV